jgi:hypothetical protein
VRQRSHEFVEKLLVDFETPADGPEDFDQDEVLSSLPVNRPRFSGDVRV